VSSADVARAAGALFTTSLGRTAPGIGCVPETISAKSAITSGKRSVENALSALVSKAI